MIVFDLKCGKDHVFEAYFADSATYEQQAEAGEIARPYCGDVEIAKAPREFAERTRLIGYLDRDSHQAPGAHKAALHYG